MLRTWLSKLCKQLFGVKNRARTMNRKPRGGQLPSFRPSLEALEDRLVPSSAAIPGLSLTNGNLYNTSISQTNPIDMGVANFTVVNNTVYDLHTNGNLESLNSNGSGMVTLDNNVNTFLVGPGGNACTLDAAGNFEVNGVQFGSGIQSFAVNGFGHVVELTTSAKADIMNSTPGTSGGNLYEFMQLGANRCGPARPRDSVLRHQRLRPRRGADHLSKSG